MRICFFAGSMSLGGIGKLTLNLAREFIDRGIEVDLFLLKEGGEYIDQVPEQVRIFVGEGSYLMRMAKFIQYLNQEKPDVSISARQRQDWANIVGCLFSFSNTEPIISVHTNITEENKRLNRENKFTSFITKILYRIPNKFIAVSKGVADDLGKRAGVEEENIKVIYNPVFVPENDPVTPNTKNLAFEDIKQKKKYIITAARFKEQKDLFTLIKAFAKVRESLNISLVLLGDGPQREEIEELIDQLSLTEHVLLTGYVDHPEYYIKDAAVYVLSSKWEGFGNVLVEAMGVGTPVVSTDCPSGPAEILENGKFGKLVPVEAPKDLAEAIIETINNPISSNKLINRAKDFSVSKIADEYLNLIEA